MRAQLQSAFTRAAGGALAGRAGRRVFRGQLRVLAYHAVPDAARFSAHVRHLVERYTPVSGQAVVAAFEGGPPLPDDPVWVTFDDGHRSIVEVGQPVLDRFGVPATMFVCPGVVDTGDPFWWAVVRAAVEVGLEVKLDDRWWTDARLVTELKSRPDAERRAVVAELTDELRHRAALPPGEQLDPSALARWMAAGHEVGNHSWDHPCLDRCAPEEQVRQVRRADAWLRSNLSGYAPFFAYPNGNWSPVVEAELERLGYRLALGFDHRLDRLRHPLRMSRLRVDSDAPLQRFAAIVAGLHAAAFHLLPRSRNGAGAPGMAKTAAGRPS